MKCDHCVKGRSCRNPVSWGAALVGQRYYFCTRHKKVKARMHFWRGTRFFKLAEMPPNAMTSDTSKGDA